MKSILVAAEDPDTLPSILASALLVAQRFGGYIEGMAIRTSAVPFVAAEGMSAAATSVLESLEAEEQERAERLKKQFRTFMQEKGVAWGEAPRGSDAPSAGWPAVEPYEAQSIGHRGRVFDLIVVGRPLERTSVLGMSIVEAALFETGHPVLIAPPSPPSEMGRVIVIAWNGSAESARSITFAMPFLREAQSVYLLEVEGSSVPGPNAKEVQRHLSRNRIVAEVIQAHTNDRTVGETILEETASRGADLLVKGAYTHSRLRQTIFGGATSHILAEARLPVLMAH